MTAVILVLVAMLTYALTGAVRRFAIARVVLDIPTERSSHSTPVPRGGGLAFVATILAALLVLCAAGYIERSLVFATVPSGALIAAVGWLDDRKGLSSAVRFIIHLAAAAWIIWWLGPVTTLRLGSLSLSLGPLAWPLTVLALVWLANAFNFMDGIDGIAAGTALTAGAASALLAAVAGATSVAWLGALIAAGMLGFLPWNWSPARIFMGDSGSVFLGFMLGVTGLAADHAGVVPVLVWALLVGVFLFDATVTLIRRVARGERWREAHRSHAYQRAVQSGLGHGAVSGRVLVLNLVLASLVAAGARKPELQTLAVGLGLLLLAACYALVERRRPMTAPGAARN